MFSPGLTFACDHPRSVCQIQLVMMSSISKDELRGSSIEKLTPLPLSRNRHIFSKMYHPRPCDVTFFRYFYSTPSHSFLCRVRCSALHFLVFFVLTKNFVLRLSKKNCFESDVTQYSMAELWMDKVLQGV